MVSKLGYMSLMLAPPMYHHTPIRMTSPKFNCDPDAVERPGTPTQPSKKVQGSTPFRRRLLGGGVDETGSPFPAGLGFC